MSQKRRWKKLARGLAVKNSSHLKQKYWDWLLLHGSSTDTATPSQPKLRGLEALRALVGKRVQNKDGSAVYIQDRKREGRPRTLPDVPPLAHPYGS